MIDFLQCNFYAHFGLIIRSAVLLFVGIPALWIAYRVVQRSLTEHVGGHIARLTGNIIFYAGLLFIAIAILNDLGFQLSALLGAAGIAGIAIGIAAQTTVSNLLSGIFLLLERAFKIGDVVTCDMHQGTVESIDLLSVKLRTFDNQLVRVPNEMFIKQSVINRSFYPNRRLDMHVRVRHEHDLEKVLGILEEVSGTAPSILKNPKARIAISEVSSWATSVLCRVWIRQEGYEETRYALLAEVKKRCDEAGIAVSVSAEF
jgi:small-conductance mechanosensitive channel